MGYTTWVVKFWTHDTPHQYIVLFTRVLSKTAKFALCLKTWLIEHLRNLGHIKHWMKVRMHSDTGPHFRSNRTLAHAAIWLPQQFGIHCSHIYGMECHGKSDLDGMMGQVQQAKEFIGSELHINSLDALTIALTTEYELRAECKQIPMVNFVNWMPSIHFDKFKTSLLKTASLPCGIKACHSWMFTICDNRQKSMVGKNGEITGTWCRATVLLGIKATPNPKMHL